jgi:DNA-binding CsgD family transcriptional regulator
MWPTPYTESDLVPLPGARPPHGGPDLVRSWLAADSVVELHSRIGEALHGLGFDWMSHARVVWRDGIPITTKWFSSHAPPRWTKIYASDSCREAAPLLRRALLSSLPLAWSLDDALTWPLKAEPLRFIQRLYDYGIRSGVLVVLPLDPQQSNSERAVVTLMSRRAGRIWITDDVLGGSFMFALCLHELLTRLTSVETAPGVLASPTRREVLHQLTQGRSNKQIAHHMQLSADTVKYHMRELLRHFNVRNRIELVNLQMRRDSN